MYHVSAQGVDERMINVHYYYYHETVGQSPATSHCCRSVTFSAVCANPSVAVRQDFIHQDHAQCTELSFHNEQRDAGQDKTYLWQR